MSSCTCDTSVYMYQCILEKIPCTKGFEGCECIDDDVCYCLTNTPCKPSVEIPCYNPDSPDCQDGICTGADCVIEKPFCFWGDECHCDPNNPVNCSCSDTTQCHFEPVPCYTEGNTGCRAYNGGLYCFSPDCKPRPNIPSICQGSNTPWFCHYGDECLVEREDLVPQSCWDKYGKPCGGPSNSGCLNDPVSLCRDEQCKSHDPQCNTLYPKPSCFEDNSEEPEIPEEQNNQRNLIVLGIIVILLLICIIFLKGIMMIIGITIVILVAIAYWYFYIRQDNLDY